MTYTITIPVPPRILSPNYRGHWAPISAAKKQYRETCRYLALSAMAPTARLGTRDLHRRVVP